jgi:rare lipoprotein A
MARWVARLLLAQTFVLGAGCVPAPVYHNYPEAPPGHPKPQRSRTPPKTARPEQSARPLDPDRISTAKAYQVGVASYYGEQFHGKRTANGETFNMYKLTAAHRVLPLGTIVRVTNLDNGRWAIVKVNDRGPFVEGRVLDLSFAAALELEMVKDGTANVMIELVDPVD